MFLQHAQRGYATARYIIVIFANVVLPQLLLCCQALVDRITTLLASKFSTVYVSNVTFEFATFANST